MLSRFFSLRRFAQYGPFASLPVPCGRGASAFLRQLGWRAGIGVILCIEINFSQKFKKRKGDFHTYHKMRAVSSSFLAEKITYVKDVSWLYNLVSERGISTYGLERSSGKAYADFSIFKGKAALLMSPVAPTFTKMDSGHQRVDKKGAVLLKFIPAIGQRKYDTERKQFFALSATEVGCLISLGPDESCEFIHDPSMKSSLEGQVKKTLAISPLNDGSGYMFYLSVMNAVQKTNERFSLPVTKAEFSVMRTACGFVLPLIMGWDRVIGPHLERTGHCAPEQSAIKIDPYSEWEK